MKLERHSSLGADFTSDLVRNFAPFASPVCDILVLAVKYKHEHFHCSIIDHMSTSIQPRPYWT